jgi:hypothetical protein
VTCRRAWRGWGFAALVSAAVLIPPAATAGRGHAPEGSGPFEPRSKIISRKSFAGITPKMSFDQVKTRWGREPSTHERDWRGVGRSEARWGQPFPYGPTAVFVYYASSRAGREPFRYLIDLAYARELGIELRTHFGDRAGTTLRQFRRHWPKAVRVPSGPDYSWYVAQPAFRGWRLAFLFSNGRLKEVELVTADYVSRCIVRRCSVYPPRGRNAAA